ncbi:MFS transporter [Aldersonia sp. NBC_00410]|uniref:MFS transporter n=1 Tax=Aldersonia sp. NBC_00410 TaxID=2975954 RepID=UPI00225BD990|nr:MFS transporter [Aldersonia sp. NBC_00410]MCX5045062.1 MFS transporter [Aldersonia sp. NBC_00410]
MTAPTAVHARAGVREWAGLVVLAFAVLLIAIDATVLDVALPFISADLAPSSPQLLWIIDVYSFVLAGLLVTMGSLGDRIGRRRLLLIGAAGFGLASLLAAFAVSPMMLIAARALQGIAGATLMPATLGLIRAIFADARQRVTAIAVWSAMAGGGAAVGPLVGGWLLEHFWWGSVFLVNIPLMLVLIVLGPMLIPESRDPNPGRFDIPSALLSMATMLPIVYAIKETAAHGPSITLAMIGLVGIGAGVAFAQRQRILEQPMIDLRLFRRPRFRTAVGTDFLSVFALAGVLFFGAQYLQLVLGNSPLQAGLLMLPGTATSVLASLLGAWLLRRYRVGAVLAGAVALSAIGAAIMLGTSADSGAGVFVVGFVLIGAGVGIALTTTSNLVVSSVPTARAGAASAVAETAYELGTASGVAILGSIVMGVFRRGLDTGALTSAQAGAAETLGGAHAVAAELADPAPFVESMQHTFVSGMHVAAAITVVVLVIAAISAARLR